MGGNRPPLLLRATFALRESCVCHLAMAPLGLLLLTMDSYTGASAVGRPSELPRPPPPPPRRSLSPDEIVAALAVRVRS